MKLTSHFLLLLGLASACPLACGGNDSQSGPKSDGAAGSTSGAHTGGVSAGGTANPGSGTSPGGTTPATGGGTSGSANGSSGSTNGGNTNGGSAGASSAGSNGGGGQPAGGASGMGVPGPDLVDARDGASYATVVIKGQTWMAENLNYATATGSWCQNNDPAQCAVSGRYYDWSVALGLPIACDSMLCKDQIQAKQQGVCPAGWHVTTANEWYGLFFTADDCAKAKTSTGWTTGAGNDSYGLAVSPTGYRTSEGFLSLGMEALYWTTNDELPNFTLAFGVGTTGCGSDQYGKNFGLSVRCIKD